MATHTVRMVTPAARGPATSADPSSTLPNMQALPERSSSRPQSVPLIEVVAGLRHSASSPILPSDLKVRFGDLPVPARDLRTSNASTTAHATATSSSPPPLPPRTIRKNKEGTRVSSESSISNSKLPQSVETLLKPNSKTKVANPFADPGSASDLPDLIPSNNADPFGDFYSVASSTSDCDSCSDASQLTPSVQIVDEDHNRSPSTTPTRSADFKEDQAFFAAIEEFNHPDVARMQFECKSGALWNSAITLLENSYLHPSDLTEDEFVTLVCSQGNATSNWLRDVARLVSSRRINNRIKLHQEFISVGLPPNTLPEFYLDRYEIMNKEERERLVFALQILKINLENDEKETYFTDSIREKYMGMNFFEKIYFVEVQKLEMEKLEQKRKENASLRKRLFNRSTSTAISKTFGEPLERVNSSAPPQYSKSKSRKTTGQFISFVENAFYSAIDKVTNARRSAATSGSGSESKLLRRSDGYEDCPGELSSEGHLNLQSRSHHCSGVPVRYIIKPFSFDSGIGEMDTASSEQGVAEPVSDHSIPGLSTKTKSGFFVDKMARFPQSLNRTDSTKNASRNFRNSSFDSDAVSVKLGENMSTAKRAVFAAPTLVKISPPCSTQSVGDAEYQKTSESLKEVSASSSNAATVATSSCLCGNCRFERSIAEKVMHRIRNTIKPQPFDKEYADVPEDQLSIAQIHARADTAKKEPGLKTASSFWALHSLPRRKAVDKHTFESQVSTDFGKAFDTVTSERNGKVKRTLRKKISTMLGAVGEQQPKGNEGKEGKDGETIVKRKLFGRKVLPEWEFSK